MIIQEINFNDKTVARCGVLTPTHNYGTHIHEFSEILFVLKGSIESTVEGKTDVLNEGDLAVITPFKPHSTYTPNFCELFICVVSNDFLIDIIPHNELFAGYEGSAFKPSLELKAYLDKNFVSAGIEAYTDQTERAIRTTKACVHAILDEFTKCTERSIRSKNRDVLSNVILYLNQNFKNPITLKSVAHDLGYAPGHISHCLSEIPEISFTMLLNSIRIEYAKNLLLSKEFSNIDIAYECGFTNERSFYRSFMRIVGKTPKEYTKSKSINKKT